MEKDEALRLLRGGPEGIDKWNRLRRTGEVIPELEMAEFKNWRPDKVDLSDAILNGADFSDARLENANFRNAKLAGAVFAANARNAKFEGANLAGVSFSIEDGHYQKNADLSRADFTEADLSNVDFLGAMLHGVNFTGATLERACFRWRNLSDVVFREAKLRGADLRKAVLHGADLKGAILCDAKLAGADLQDANLQHADLTGADLQGADLIGADLREAQLIRANLQSAHLIRAVLVDSRLDDASLSRAVLSDATLNCATLINATLSGACLCGATLVDVDLQHADLRGADLGRARFIHTDLRHAKLGGANLQAATLLQANLEYADLEDCSVYGIGTWDLKLTHARQSNLVITLKDQPTITVDNLEVAQFIYLLLHNQKIRDVINTITSKVVLILGRFTPERKDVLDAIREQLRSRDYCPVMFDFEKPARRDFTETVSALAHLARFIVADITDARSIPQELQAIVPTLSVPVQPILQESGKPYGMFPDFSKYPWVLPLHRYSDGEALIRVLPGEVIVPAEAKAKELEANRRIAYESVRLGTASTMMEKT